VRTTEQTLVFFANALRIAVGGDVRGGGPEQISIERFTPVGS